MDCAERILAVDLGGTKTAVSIWMPEGWCLEKRRFETIQGPPGPNLERIAALGHELLEGRRPAAVGVSGGGPLDPVRGVIISIPNLPGWEEVPIAEFLSGQFGAPVGIENDAKAGNRETLSISWTVFSPLCLIGQSNRCIRKELHLSLVWPGNCSWSLCREPFHTPDQLSFRRLQ